MSSGDYSGRVLLRIPSSLHRLLVSEAEREGVSLNQFAAAALAAAVHWRTEEQPAAHPVTDREELAH